MITYIHRVSFLFGLLFSSLLLVSCASHIPEYIKTPPANNPDLEQVRASPDKFQSQAVRWGGVILETENTNEATSITILALRLNSYGQPIAADNTPGRFIAKTPAFLEPAVYARDRMITVTGKVLRVETRQVGEFSYDYPVVQVENHYLWSKEVEPSDYDIPPWWYDPWFDPYHPYYYPRWHHH
ncbi:MAG: Slp family lipoprotein [Gammaproteobacteria bacterium]|nr:Slp family lipoprotein [Gammaproteobacteria bacterium]